MHTTEADLREALIAAGQEHVLPRLDLLDSARRAALVEELSRIDLPLLAELGGLLSQPPPEGGSAFEAPDLFPLERSRAQEEEAGRAVACGEELLSGGRVAFVLVAGGQASRLGYDAPKGAFPVGPVTGRPLFEFHAHRLRRARERWGKPMPWYIMTSPANDAETKRIFEEAGFYGLPREEVSFFAQEMLPALDSEGRILFKSSDHLFLAPNGHGGVLLGLRSSGALEEMRAQGIEQLSYFQVDNPLVRPTDPLFLGLHHLAGAGMSSKVVVKRGPEEKVGVIGRSDGKLGCIEYSDLPEELREARERDGGLRFRAGNIAVHVLSVPFLEEVTGGALRLPWHVARKQMKVADEAGETVEVAGAKFETFVFDALARSERSVTLEVDRRLEFSPVKNAEGEDSPATSRRALCSMFAGWVEAAGLELPPPDGEGVPCLEVDPRLAETKEEFLVGNPRRKRVIDGGHLYE
jgi:UDP-N-acetylglucosamine/UDP-N-acetylgalactosamine diphosphorylase